MKDKFSNVQFGFRPNMRTADSLFIFKTLINKYFNLLKNVDSKIISYTFSPFQREFGISIHTTNNLIVLLPMPEDWSLENKSLRQTESKALRKSMKHE
jgi:hypothetical protein